MGSNAVPDHYIKKVNESSLNKFIVKLECVNCNNEWALTMPEGDRLSTGFKLTTLISRLYNISTEWTYDLHCPECCSAEIKLIDKHYLINE